METSWISGRKFYSDLENFLTIYMFHTVNTSAHFIFQWSVPLLSSLYSIFIADIQFFQLHEIITERYEIIFESKSI